MATTPDDTHEEPAEEERQESFWDSFNRADAKLFLVTFAGTVAANVLTVMLVAIAIISDRARFVKPTSTGVIFSLIVALFGGLGIVGARQVLREKGQTRLNKGVGWIVVAFMCSVTLLIVLSLLGYAAGIK